jgi:hypothetical protein
MSQFTYSWKTISFTISQLSFHGTLDREIDPRVNPEIKELQTKIKDKSPGKVIVFDLTDFDTWDTEGIRAILDDCVVDLVVKDKAKIGFIGPKIIGKLADGESRYNQVYSDAKIKCSLIDTQSLPWEENIRKTLEALKVAIPDNI